MLCLRRPGALPLLTLPRRVCLETGCRLLTDVRCVRPLIVAGTGRYEPSRRAALEAAGAEVCECGVTSTGRLDMREAMAVVTGRFRSAMVEGGAAVITSVLQPDVRPIITSMVLTVAPSMIGGVGCVQALLPTAKGGGGAAAKYERWCVDACGVVGGDVVLCLVGGGEEAAVAVTS